MKTCKLHSFMGKQKDIDVCADCIELTAKEGFDEYLKLSVKQKHILFLKNKSEVKHGKISYNLC